MEDINAADSKFLTSCLCKLQLPHSAEHARVFQKPEMPTVQLAESKLSHLADIRQSRRVQELLDDVQEARAEDERLHRKFEKDAEELLQAYEAGEQVEHWTPLEPGPGEADGGDALRLQLELRHSRFQLAEVRNQLHSLKRELAAYERLVRQELGPQTTLREAIASPRRKGRAQEIKRLKAEIRRLEKHAHDHKYLGNAPAELPCFDPPLPDVDDLVPPEQARALERQARRRAEQRGRLEQEVSALIEQYGNVSLMYKASLTHNKMLAEELRSLKEQLAKYEDRALENRNLLKDLIAHQLQMRQMVDREAHLARLVRKKQGEDAGLGKADEVDAARYKALYESCEAEKSTLEKLLGVLTKRLEAVIRTAEEAELHCEANDARRREIEQLIEAQQAAAAAAQAAPKAKGKAAKADSKVKGKGKATPSAASQLPTAAQLDAVREENKFLRQFLLKAIENKVEDLRLYQLTMDSVRQQYVDTLKELGEPKEDGGAPKTD